MTLPRKIKGKETLSILDYFFCQDIFILTTDVTKETFLTKKYLPVVENGPYENL